VHLAGKADGGDGIRCEARDLQCFANGERCRPPPVARVLLRPAGLRAGEIGVLSGARGEDRAVFVEDDGAGSAGSDVDAEDWNTPSYLRETHANLARDLYPTPFW